MAYLGLPQTGNIKYSGCDFYVTSWNICSTWGMEGILRAVIIIINLKDCNKKIDLTNFRW